MLLMHDGHFDVITKLPGFFDSSYFCLECEKAYSSETYNHHSCRKTKCEACLQKKCHDYNIFKHTENSELPCKECNRKFYGVMCQLNHLTQKANGQSVAPSERNVCQSHKKCPICLHLYTSTSQEHVKHCGLQYCPNCSKEVNILQHKCFLQSIDDDNDKKTLSLCTLTLRRIKTLEIILQTYYVQKQIRTINNSPFKANNVLSHSFNGFIP